MNNLPEIKDIYIPQGVSYFPLAYGWWIIGALVLGGILLVIFTLWAIKTSRKYYALKRLELISLENPVIAAVEISKLLKRICKFNHSDALVLYGSAWADFLNKHTTHPLNEKERELLINAPFINSESKKYTAEDVLLLKQFAKYWIGANL